jgi:hypothetical protein
MRTGFFSMYERIKAREDNLKGMADPTHEEKKIK